jgi:hypothetical protein
MGWEFAAVWVDDPDRAWRWVWRRIADDSGAILAQSEEFTGLDRCIEDAKRSGFDDGDTNPA